MDTKPMVRVKRIYAKDANAWERHKGRVRHSLNQGRHPVTRHDLSQAAVLGVTCGACKFAVKDAETGAWLCDKTRTLFGLEQGMQTLLSYPACRLIQFAAEDVLKQRRWPGKRNTR